MSKIKINSKRPCVQKAALKIFLYVYYADNGEMEVNALIRVHTRYTHIVFNSSYTKTRVINLEKSFNN